MKKKEVVKKVMQKQSFNLDENVLHKLKYVAWYDRTTQSEILDTLLSNYFERWQNKNGKIPKTKK